MPPVSHGTANREKFAGDRHAKITIAGSSHD
jgi:hypothetical protein